MTATATTMTEQAVSLPATGRTVPGAAAGITITGLRSLEHSRGIAVTAKARRGQTLLGTIDNQGVGGMTVFDGATAETNREWDEMDTAYRAITAAEAEGDSTDPDEFVYRPETLADALLEEAEVMKALARATKKGTPVREAQTDVTAWYLDGCPMAVLPHAAQVVLANGSKAPARFAEVWDGAAWVAIPRPAAAS